MKYICLLLSISLTISLYSQDSEYNLEDGFVAKGYDLVAYFDDSATEGKEEFSVSYDGLKFKFSTQENLNKFNKMPEKYLPQYGGWCAYAVADSGSRVNINPKAFEIRNGKLYLFYKTFFVNTLKKWKKGNPEKLKGQADENWSKVGLSK